MRTEPFIKDRSPEGRRTKELYGLWIDLEPLDKCSLGHKILMTVINTLINSLRDIKLPFID